MSSYSDFLTQEEINRLLGFGSDTQADEDKEAECESKYRKANEALEEIIKDLERYCICPWAQTGYSGVARLR